VGLSLLAQAKVFGRNGGLYALQLPNNYAAITNTRQLQNNYNHVKNTQDLLPNHRVGRPSKTTAKRFYEDFEHQAQRLDMSTSAKQNFERARHDSF
jgi:hypothetical protein